MFKELGEFIDNVGRATGRMIGQILSDKDDDDGILMGYSEHDISDDDLDSMCEDGLITEEQRDALKSSKVDKIE